MKKGSKKVLFPELGALRKCFDKMKPDRGLMSCFLPGTYLMAGPRYVQHDLPHVTCVCSDGLQKGMSSTRCCWKEYSLPGLVNGTCQRSVLEPTGCTICSRRVLVLRNSDSIS